MISAVSSSIHPNALSFFNGDRIAFVEQIKELSIHAGIEDYKTLNYHVSNYISDMIPVTDNHDELVAEFQDYKFNNDAVDFEWLLDNVRQTYTVKELKKQLKMAGMSKKEIDMLLACVYEECFLTTVSGDGHMYLPLHFSKSNKRYASSILTLYWRNGCFFTQVS